MVSSRKLPSSVFTPSMEASPSRRGASASKSLGCTDRREISGSPRMHPSISFVLYGANSSVHVFKIQARIALLARSCNSSAFRLHCHKSMHTGCFSRSLAPAGLGVPLQKQRDTSRDSGRLNCNQKLLYLTVVSCFLFCDPDQFRKLRFCLHRFTSFPGGYLGNTFLLL